MRRSYLSIALVLGFICTAPAVGVYGQSSSDARWNSLASLSEGTRLVVDLDGQRSMTAKFVLANDRALVINRGGFRVEVPRDSISAIHLGKRTSRAKRALIGGLAGAGAGVAIGVVATATAKADPLIAAGGFLIGIPVGAGIGAATGGKTRKGEMIYSR